MIYLDNAATSFPKPEAVYKVMDKTLRESCGNANRGVHSMATSTTQMIREVRAQLAELIGAEDPSRLVFTLNTTDSLNMAIKGFVTPGCHVVTTRIEHNSVLRPLAALKSKGIIQISHISLDKRGIIDPEKLKTAVKNNTKLVILTQASNVLGTVQPVSEVARICKEMDLTLLVDGAQSIGEIPVDVNKLGIDMLAFPGHKSLLGPQGTGALYVREGLKLNPWREGGTGTESAVEFQPETYPVHLEAGTSNLPGIAGLGEGIKYIKNRGMDVIHHHCSLLIKTILDFLQSDRRFIVYGDTNPDRHVHALSFNIRDVDPGDAGLILDQSFGIAVRTGLHCAAPIHRILGTHPCGTIRVSPGPMNTEVDIQKFIDALKEIVNQ